MRTLAAIAFACIAAFARGAQAVELADVERALARDPRALPAAEASRWLAWKPDDAVSAEHQAQLGAGRAAYLEGDYGAALVQLYGLLERAPDHPAALYQLGSTYFRLRRYGDCAAVMERFVRAVPSQVGATQALGHSYYTLGRYDEARAHYERVLEAAPESVEAWRGLGLAHMRSGATERALACLEKALELKPEHADARGWYAQVLWEAGRNADALSQAERARDGAPYEPRHWFLLARLYGDLGRDEAAAAASERFTELNRIEQEIRTQEGLLLHDARALAPLRRLVELQVSARNAGEARQAVQRLLRTGGGDVENALLALEALLALQELDNARKLAAEIEKRFPREIEAWRALAEFYRAVRDEAGAQRAKERLRELETAK